MRFQRDGGSSIHCSTTACNLWRWDQQDSLSADGLGMLALVLCCADRGYAVDLGRKSQTQERAKHHPPSDLILVLLNGQLSVNKAWVQYRACRAGPQQRDVCVDTSTAAACLGHLGTI